uniref:RRM domain-containing protein n=1 Tax=Pseudo-nitzschia australis TaxID=44445 RepID=A0A6U9XJG5_9STRA|eukprot:CAMPEP_0168170578 /NCGR_PEP_ID=MMETSP0139_2-20121125/4256_1 /TAXON_ID=44445 /ORGANISM="Pseudo-nitzschia australis, Strain 10249 10 AB" /LENGTH=327 /DNA_ID=CAMNT_0008088093 /DNA_START=54 /DNA_END=1037 /DNA_ORIENTATION=-
MSDTVVRDDNLVASDEANTEENEQPGKSDVNKKRYKKSKKKKKKKGADNESSKESIPSSKIKKMGDADPKDGRKGEAPISDKNEAATTNSDDDDNDDDDLLAAAALWAGNDGEEEAEKSFHESTMPGSKITPPSRQNYSLHITQLPYDSTEFDLRKLFADHGCSVTSIRLVYDHDTEGRKTVFRGVAFVDLLDSQSYDTALKLHHKTKIRGRRLNVRPCRSKEELAEIVARTQELVQEKIREQRSMDGNQSSATGKDHGTLTSSQPNPRNSENKSNTSKRKNSNNQKDRKNNKKPRVDKDGKPIKLTKKERNRRAAILMQKRRGQKK